MIKNLCNKIRIGETSRSLKHRTMEHRSTIKRNDPTSSGARHSNASNHPATSPAFLGIEAIKSNQRGGSLDFIQKKNERRIFDFLLFSPPGGLNRDFSFNYFLSSAHLPSTSQPIFWAKYHCFCQTLLTLLTKFIGPWLQSPSTKPCTVCVCLTDYIVCLMIGSLFLHFL